MRGLAVAQSGLWLQAVAAVAALRALKCFLLRLTWLRRKPIPLVLLVLLVLLLTTAGKAATPRFPVEQNKSLDMAAVVVRAEVAFRRLAAAAQDCRVPEATQLIMFWHLQHPVWLALMEALLVAALLLRRNQISVAELGAEQMLPPLRAAQVGRQFLVVAAEPLVAVEAPRHHMVVDRLVDKTAQLFLMQQVAERLLQMDMQAQTAF